MSDQDTRPTSRTAPADGERLLSAVERIIADRADLIARVAEASVVTERIPHEPERVWLAAVAARLVTMHARMAAVSGGATALPSLFPGVGTAIAAAGTLADMTLVLKFEVEMALCLTQLYGWDIEDPHERQLAFLLASVETLTAHDRGSAVKHMVATEATAIWNYAPRQVSKALLTAMGRLTVRSVARGALRLLPIVGVAVGAGVNQTLTRRVGKRCARELDRRRFELTEAAAPRGDRKA
ncbi:MAG: EcsC family protein [Deltaproteobacteria bacterium]|nr:EcsC family protein [Deltaproteobacteria bacterium]